MSWYRALRLAAVVSLLNRYRAPLARMLAAVLFALVTAWLYSDVAVFLDRHRPQWSAAALIIKTLVVYLALFLCFFELARLLRSEPETRQAAATAARSRPSQPAAKPSAQPRPLDQLAEKPQLRSRRDELLKDP